MRYIALFLLILRWKAKKKPTKGQKPRNRKPSGMIFADIDNENSKNFK
jgi:hypothetical protein